MPRVLNVAEKPSVAKEVSRILSNGHAHRRNGVSQFNANWDFGYTLGGRQAQMVFTSVAGHLMELEFTASHRGWRSCSPGELFTAPVLKAVPQDKAALRRNLEQEARQAQELVLWLDCDREGENIGFEVVQVCLGANPRLVVRRARFSALIAVELHRAVNNLVPPDENAAKAVDARQEIDLRIGAAFTRYQTLLLQSKFDWLAGGLRDADPLISYGPCQFPTLGLIVQRDWEIQSHVPEPYWEIKVSYREPGGKHCDFRWSRGQLFDHAVATMLYEPCVADPMATVLKVDGREIKRWPPHPLATLDMQKTATRVLRMPGERIMKLAEELYQAGFISYPRTETDRFDPAYDLRGMIAPHMNDPNWGAHATAMINGNMFRQPVGGRNDDKAHPPIHPTRYTPGEQGWAHDKKALYDFVVRSFLAACSQPAIGFETTVTISIAEETFVTTGLMVTQRNWLEVYPYTNWGGNDSLPAFAEGQRFMPSELMLNQSQTAPPPRLTEAALIAAMEAHGIGTDATVAEHIQKQLERGYAVKDANMTLSATPLGEALVAGYRAMGLANLWTPDLRGKIEANIAAVAAGQRSKEAVLTEAVQAFSADFQEATRQAGLLEAEVATFFGRAAGGGGGGGNAAGGGADGGVIADVGDCPACRGQLSLRKAGDATFVTCGSHPLCATRVVLPTACSEAAVTDQRCASCPATVRLLQLRFRRARIPADVEPAFTGCVLCDARVRRLLDFCGPARLPAPAGGPNRNQGRGGANPQHPQQNGGRGGGGGGHRGGNVQQPNAGGGGRGGENRGGGGGGGRQSMGARNGGVQRRQSAGRGRGGGGGRGGGRRGGRGRGGRGRGQ